MWTTSKRHPFREPGNGGKSSPHSFRDPRDGGNGPRPAVQLTPGFCLLLAWFAAASGWRPLLLVLCAAAVHEAGHLAALSLLGGRVRGLRLSVQGAALDIDASRLSYGRELACLLAGPAANFLLAAVTVRLGLDALTGASVLLGAYNLLPVRPLDGGRAVELSASALWGPRGGDAAARIFSAAGGLLLAAATAGFIVLLGGTLWLLPPLWGFLSSALGELAETDGGRSANCRKKCCKGLDIPTRRVYTVPCKEYPPYRLPYRRGPP